MNFKYEPPDWENVGKEPDKDLKGNGFQAGYKPAASLFNWFWHLTGKCIQELQEKIQHLKKADVGLDKVDNTADLDKPLSKAVQQELEKKANNTMATSQQSGLLSNLDKIKLDNIAANAEVNQNAFSFARANSTTISATQKTDTINFAAGTNITLAANNNNKTITIHAAASIKNPQSLTIQTNGSTQLSYDGSISKTINITAASLGTTPVTIQSTAPATNYLWCW